VALQSRPKRRLQTHDKYMKDTRGPAQLVDICCAFDALQTLQNVYDKVRNLKEVQV
jgi:hypothetical protein